MAVERATAAPKPRKRRKPASATTRERRAARRSRKAERQDAEYLAWIRTQPCLTCGVYGTAPHHEPPVSHAGAWHDHFTVPLCQRCHAMRHSVLGLRLFEARFRVRLASAIVRYRERYLKDVGPADGF